jgi:hypothetical protein
MAAEAVLRRSGSVGPLELFQQMGLLHPVHVEGRRKGNDYYRVLQPWTQVGPEKFQKAIRHFQEWAKQRGLRTIEAAYTRRGPRGVEQLHVTAGGDPEWERFCRTHYAAGDLPEKQVARLAAKLNKPPELVVFEKVSEEGNCSECGAQLPQGAFLFMEKSRLLCLSCADLDELVFLPAGDTALTRRVRKHRPLAAAVVRFNRAHKRYERQGLLVGEDALAKAEAECTADAPAQAGAQTRGQVRILTNKVESGRCVEARQRSAYVILSPHTYQSIRRITINHSRRPGKLLQVSNARTILLLINPATAVRRLTFAPARPHRGAGNDPRGAASLGVAVA